MMPDMQFDRVPGTDERITILWQPKFHYCNYDCFYCPVKKARESQKHFKWDKNQFLSVLDRITTLSFNVDLVIGPGGEPFISQTILDAISVLSHSLSPQQ